VSSAGQRPESVPDGIVVATFPMPGGTLFSWHTHVDHQLAWAARGVLTVLTEGATWVLPTTRALWIPAGLPHETGAASVATMRSVYIPVDLTPVNWTAPTPVAASPLLAELISYLGTPSHPGGPLTARRRAHAETLLADLLEPVPLAAINVPFPTGPLTAAIASALRDNPADQRTLADWGRVVGASERTLARAFSAQARMPFGRWRTLLRLQAALPLLARGEPVARVAHRVGYQTPSAFVAAFRRETGQTPAAYFARTPEAG
jgi:AraC-like DNA-binding protein/quercetin dioxygenase-like cupin family protein